MSCVYICIYIFLCWHPASMYPFVKLTRAVLFIYFKSLFKFKFHTFNFAACCDIYMD